MNKIMFLNLNTINGYHTKTDCGHGGQKDTYGRKTAGRGYAMFVGAGFVGTGHLPLANVITGTTDEK